MVLTPPRGSKRQSSSLIQYVLHIFRQFGAGVRFAVHLCGSLGHMEDHGVPVFYGIRQVFTDNRRQTDVDGVAEKDSGKGFCDNSLYTKCL